MIRRDYLLRHIEEFASLLARINSLAKHGQWHEASDLSAMGIRELTGFEPEEVLRMQEIRLLSHLMEGEPVHGVANKLFRLAALLKAWGDVELGSGHPEESARCYLKGLHVLLEAPGGDLVERPDFVPAVDALVLALENEEIPPPTLALLMRHYEMAGVFGKAEDALFRIVQAVRPTEEIARFGEGFYRRILAQSDNTLMAGNLPRTEAEQGLAEFRTRIRRPEDT